MDCIRINAWSSPRNVSTALMYAFAQRPDTRVVDEPLYAHYLTHQPTDTDHPGREAILASQDVRGERVIRELILGPCPAAVVFFKQMTHHLVKLPLDFLEQTKNVLLIRDPRAILASFAKVIPDPELQDVGIRQQVSLFEHLARRGQPPVVVDAKQLLLRPESVLRQLCHRLDIPFYPQMLRWPAGPKPEDGVWAPYWYGSVHRSTGFRPYRERHLNLPEPLETLARAALPYYQRLFEHALLAEGPNPA